VRSRGNKNIRSNQGMNWLNSLRRMNESKAVWAFITALLLIVLILGGLVFSGCTGARGSIPKGWSGGTIAGDTLVIGSMEGKLVAVNMTAGSRLWESTLETTEPPRSIFGCAPASTAVAIYGSPVVEGDLVYVGGYNGRVYAISSSTRLSTFRSLRKDENAPVFPIVGGAVVNSGKVYIGSSDGCVYAMDSLSLELVWDKPFKTGDKIWSTPAIDGDTLFIGSFDKKLYAIDTATGQAKWEKPFETEGAIVATPVVHDNTVYIGSFDKNLYAVDVTDGTLKWKFMAKNWFWAKPVIYNDIVYAGCLDGRVYILDAQSGNKLDELDLKSPVSSSPVLAGDSVIVAVEEGKVYAIDTSTNKIKWTNGDLKEEKQKIYASLCSGEGKVYIHTNKGELHVLNTQSGAKLWSISLKSS